MKVILLQDVAQVGRRFEVREVPTGHALNFLIPKKMVEPATPENLKKVHARTSRQAAEVEAAGKSFDEALEKLRDRVVSLAVEANEQGHLFKGINQSDIAEALKGEGVAVAEKHIVLAAPIKEVGEHTVTLSSEGAEGTFTLTVVAKK